MKKSSFWKKYNPFKMWGAYVGMILGSIPGILSLYASYSANKACGIAAAAQPGFTCMRAPLSGLPILIMGLLAGFFIGWGIHSLFRRLRGK